MDITSKEDKAGLWVDEVAGTASRKIFVDEDIYMMEQRQIFAKSWLFLAHASEIPNRGDYVTRMLSNDPVIIIRGEDGVVRAFLNSCPHRGTMLCRSEAGTAKNFKCPYHGWVFGLNGSVLSVAYPPEVAQVVQKTSDGLLAMPKVSEYAGLIFGSWDADAVALDDYLGDSRFYIDLFANRTPGGMEVLGPPQRWVFNANWKLGALNFGADGPHAASVHGPITYLTLAVPHHMVVQQLMASPAIVMGNGHNGIFLNLPDNAPDFMGFSADLVPLYKQKLKPDQFKFLARALTKVMTTFPNTSWVESSVRFAPDKASVPFCNLRTWQPLGAQKTEVWNWLLIEKEAAEEFRKESYEMGIRTFSAAGTFDQDDAEAWCSINLACRGTMGSTYKTDFRGVRYYRDLRLNDFAGPGSAYPSTYSEMSEFNLLIHWQKLMEKVAT